MRAINAKKYSTLQLTFGKKDALEMEGLYPRIGISSIAAYILEKGIEVNIIDP